MSKRLSECSPRKFKGPSEKETFDFSPAISERSASMNRDNDVYYILTEDAEKRKERGHQRSSSKHREISKRQKDVVKPNDKSNVIMAKRFEADFMKAYRALTGSKEINTNISRPTYHKIIFCLGFTKSLNFG